MSTKAKKMKSVYEIVCSKCQLLTDSCLYIIYFVNCVLTYCIDLQF